MTERVTISSSGVITIPARLREACGLKADDELILETVSQRKAKEQAEKIEEE